MPQLEISTYLTQIFWLLVTFIAFWVVMDKFLIPKTSEMIEARKRKYDDFILKAEEINQKALNALNRYEETLAVAKANAKEQIDQNERELKAVVTEKQAEVTRELQQKMAQQSEILAKEKSELMEKVDELSKNVTYTILQQLKLDMISKTDIDKVAKGEKLA